MANWIFQGNSNSFYVNEIDSNQADSLNDYVKNNKVFLWDLRQIYYEKEITVGDYVLIWRLNGSKANTGGIIALIKVLKNPHRLARDLLIDYLKFIIYILTGGPFIKKLVEASSLRKLSKTTYKNKEVITYQIS